MNPLNFKYAAQDSELQKSFDEALQKAIKAHQIAINDLTEKQCCEVFKQAIQCGDIQKLVRQTDDAQSVIYIPFEEQQRLQFRIQELEAQIRALCHPDSRTEGMFPVILYLKTKEDQDGLVADLQRQFENLKVVKL